MIDGIFTRLKPETSSAIRKPFANTLGNTNNIANGEVDIEDLTAALASVSGEIELAHSSFQRLYEEASYIYNRLNDMEKSYTSQQKTVNSAQQNKENDGDAEGGSGTSSVTVKKILFADAHNNPLEGKLLKIQEAKQLTKNLLNAIETLSEKVKNANRSPAIPAQPATVRSTPRFEMK